MSSFPEYILVGLGRINDFLPVPAFVSHLPGNVKRKIPFGMGEAYDLFETEIFGKRFLLCGIEETEGDISPTILARHRDVLLKQTELTPIFIFKKPASYLFRRYAKKNIDVVVSGSQLFLPSVFLIAGKEKVSVPANEMLPPKAFQMMVLYDIEKRKLSGMTMREISKRLNLSYATINRSVRWMKEKGFLMLNGGKEKNIEFLLQGKELWEKALPFLASPINFIVYTSDFGVFKDALASEQNALSEYTMLNGGTRRIAISMEVYKDLKKQNVFQDGCGDVEVEVWKYDPHLLSDEGLVDKLSLYLILKDDEDERVQIELENMMNEIVW